jgi:hypothetical protein
MIGLPTRDLPMGLQEPDRFERVETSVVHPVVGLAEAGQIARRVVAGIVVKMRNRQAGADL